MLREQHAHVTMESLPARFSTVHQELTQNGAVTVAERGGLLTDSLASSIATPLMFSDLNVRKVARLI